MAVNTSLAPWRYEIADWPIRWREHWGIRANALEDQGHNWIEAERLAWGETIEAWEKEAEERKAKPKQKPAPPTIPLAPPVAQGLFKETA